MQWNCKGVELFKSSKEDAIKILYSLCQQIWKIQQKPQDWKRFNPHPNSEECANHQTIALISHASKVMLKILHSRLQHYANQELPDVQAGFRKGRWTRDQITNICWIIKQGNFRKASISVSLNKLKLSTVWIMTNCGKLLERWGYQTILSVSWETCMQIRNQKLKTCMEQLIGTRSRTECDRAICCHVTWLIYIQSPSWEIPGWMSFKPESR